MSSAAVVYGPLTDEQRAYLVEARDAVETIRAGLTRASVLLADASAVSLVQAMLDRELVGDEDIGLQEALGVALGDDLARRLDYAWACVTDQWGQTAAVVHPTRRTQAYPIDWIAKRFEQGNRRFEVATWFEQLVATVRNSAAGADPR